MAKNRITVLVENATAREDLLAEHGLSFFIECNGAGVLFDTGQSSIIGQNARSLGVELAKVQTIAISHGHYDHTGGLPEVLNMSIKPRLFINSSAFGPKYSCHTDRQPRFIGMPDMLSEEVLRKSTELFLTEGPTEIGAGLWLTGPVPRNTDFEDTGGPFYLDKTCQDPDPLLDDQAAFFDTPKGMVVILGCAHSGVINTLHYIQRLTHDRHICLVIGGMHLLGASPRRMVKTIEALRSLDIDMLMPCHCTGHGAIERLQLELPGRLQACPAGTLIELEG